MDLNNLKKNLKKVTPLPRMELDIFLALKKLLPMQAIELFVTNPDGQFILVKRNEKLKDLALPGGYLGLNEDFDTACQRIAKKHLGVKVVNIELISVFNLKESIHGKNNGHAVVLVFKCQLNKPAKNIEYFGKLPNNVLSHHKLMVKKILNG